LKGHLLVEHLLVRAAGVRLRVADPDVPRFGFAALMDIAFVAASHDRRSRVVWFNNLRNSIAHEYEAFDEPNFASHIKKFGVVWPEFRHDRAQILKALIEYVALLVWVTGEQSQSPPIREEGPQYLQLLADIKHAEKEIAQFERVSARTISNGCVVIHKVSTGPRSKAQK
jgi:hypothetical protein